MCHQRKQYYSKIFSQSFFSINSILSKCQYFFKLIFSTRTFQTQLSSLNLSAHAKQFTSTPVQFQVSQINTQNLQTKMNKGKVTQSDNNVNKQLPVRFVSYLRDPWSGLVLTVMLWLWTAEEIRFHLLR